MYEFAPYFTEKKMSYNTPSEILTEFTNSTIGKSTMPTLKFIVLALLGGAFISFGGLLTVIVAGGMPDVALHNPGLVKLMAGILFPVGLIMVSVAGADLFTSDCAGTTLGFFEKRLKIRTCLKILILSYIFNFIGAQFIAHCLSANVGLFSTTPWKDYLFTLADKKLHMDFMIVVMKGVGANWLVCLATWMGYAGRDVTSKSLGIWIPVMVFVTLGYEHSIANMFFIPAAIYAGADITWSQFITTNLIPATIGNFIGGALFVGGAYWFVYGKKKST